MLPPLRQRRQRRGAWRQCWSGRPSRLQWRKPKWKQLEPRAAQLPNGIISRGPWLLQHRHEEQLDRQLERGSQQRQQQEQEQRQPHRLRCQAAPCLPGC